VRLRVPVETWVAVGLVPRKVTLLLVTHVTKPNETVAHVTAGNVVLFFLFFFKNKFKLKQHSIKLMRGNVLESVLPRMMVLLASGDRLSWVHHWVVTPSITAKIKLINKKKEDQVKMKCAGLPSAWAGVSDKATATSKKMKVLLLCWRGISLSRSGQEKGENRRQAQQQPSTRWAGPGVPRYLVVGNLRWNAEYVKPCGRCVIGIPAQTPTACRRLRLRAVSGAPSTNPKPISPSSVSTDTSWELAHYPHTTNSLHKATFEIKIVLLDLEEIAWLEQGESGLFLLHALVEELEVELVQVGLDLKEGNEVCTIDRA
jgi:hypothetical protein